MDKIVFGNCTKCNKPLRPVYFVEEEIGNCGIPTGRIRDAVDYLYCPICGKKEAIDGETGSGPWRQPHKE